MDRNIAREWGDARHTASPAGAHGWWSLSAQSSSLRESGRERESEKSEWKRALYVRVVKPRFIFSRFVSLHLRYKAKEIQIHVDAAGWSRNDVRSCRNDYYAMFMCVSLTVHVSWRICAAAAAALSDDAMDDSTFLRCFRNSLWHQTLT